MKLKKKIFYFAFVLTVGLGTFLTLAEINKTHDPRTKAAGSTTISLVPASSSKQVGDSIDLDMMIDPGTNLVSFVKFQVQFDPTKIQLATDPFTIDTTSFAVKVEGPIKTDNTLGESVSVGADATKVIQKPSKIGTLHLKAIAPTGGVATTVTFTDLTQALSIGSNETPRQNVLSSTNPANITIGANSSITPSEGVNPTTGMTSTPVPTGAGLTTLSFDLMLHGVGSAGDNPNPSGNSLSNKTPLHPQRELKVEIYNSSNQIVSSSSGKVNYDSRSGTFKGAIALGPEIKEGNYAIKLLTPRYLKKLIPGIRKLSPFKDNTITQVQMIAGDTNTDNRLNILDYNAFLDCGYGVLNPLPIDDANSYFNKKTCQIHTPTAYIDVEDNGVVNSFDYNLFLRELSVQNGD